MINRDSPPTAPVLGVRLSVTNYRDAVEQVKAVAIERERVFAVSAANTHVVTLTRTDSEFQRALSSFELILPDGMPLVWVMNRQLEQRLSDRVYGPTFMLRCLEATQGDQWSHFFLGGSEELLQVLQAKLLERFPNLRVAGIYSPPFGVWPAEENERIIRRIQGSGANFIWVGLGCPKQEFWIARLKSELPPGVYSAVGAAFAFHAGRVKQAPAWLQKYGLEWLFRLVAEPRRLWRRYFVYNSLFIYFLIVDRFRRSRRGVEPSPLS